MKTDTLLSAASIGIVVCVSGEMEVIINEQPYKVIRGSYYLISPLIKTIIISKSQDYKELEMLESIEHFHFIMHRLSSIIGQLAIPSRPLMQADENTLKLMIEQYKRIHHYKELLNSTSKHTERVLYELLLEHAIQGLWFISIEYYYKHHEHSLHPQRHYSQVTTSFVVRINQEFREQRSVSYYAEQAHLSTGHFSHIIKAETGLSPIKLIIMVTINNAKLLLEQTDKTIKEIAHELGFPEQFTFRKYFKKHVGISPKEYRKNPM